MNKASLWIVWLLGSIFCAVQGITVSLASDIQLTMPPKLYATAGCEMNVFFANTILAEQPEKYQFEVECQIGDDFPDKWTIEPEDIDAGTYDFSLTVLDSEGTPLSNSESKLIVTTQHTDSQNELRLLIIGDSLTHASQYSNQIATLLSQPGNPTFTMLGTHQPTSAHKNVFHEGYGGWTWQRFVEHYEPNPDGTHRKRSSPFVFLDQQGTPKLDVQQYIDQHCHGIAPNFVIFKLGINDCFHVDPNNLELIDKKIDEVFQHAERLIAAFREVTPNATLGVCLTTPGNSRDAAFEANYKGKYTRWGWRRIQHWLVQRQIEHFTGRESENISIIPTELNLDTQDGYPTNNGVHPNTKGYQQIGNSIYAWLKYRLSQ